MGRGMAHGRDGELGGKSSWVGGLREEGGEKKGEGLGRGWLWGRIGEHKRERK